MRRLPWTRLIKGLWALWFAAILAQPAPLMTPLMLATMPMGTMAGAGTHAAAHMSRDMAGMPGSDDNASSPPRAPADQRCMHLGACCCTPVLTKSFDAVPQIPEAPIRLVRADIPSNVASTPRQLPAHARPFAIGPPAVLV